MCLPDIQKYFKMTKSCYYPQVLWMKSVVEVKIHVTSGAMKSCLFCSEWMENLCDLIASQEI